MSATASEPIERPSGVTAIATIFLGCAVYLGAAGGVMLAAPGTVSMAAGAPLLGGLELAGPYMFLLVAVAAGWIGWGLLRLNNWARRAAIVVAMIGVMMQIPQVSAAAVDFGPSLAWSGLGIIVRVVVIWYLYQGPVAEEFGRARRTPPSA